MNRLRENAEKLGADIAALSAALEQVSTRREKKALRARLKMARDVKRWIETRRGFSEDPCG